MDLRSKLVCFMACLLSSSAVAGIASAATLAGTFTADDQMASHTWNLSQNSNVVISTDSYGMGGFVPVVSLFSSSTGAFIAEDGGDATCSHGMSRDSTTGICNDAYLSTPVSKGSYLVVLTEFSNFPNGSNLSDGFSEAGQGNFTSSFCSSGTGPFLEIDLAPCVQRTGNYSATLSAVATPEPATGWLALPVFVLVAFAVRSVKSA